MKIKLFLFGTVFLLAFHITVAQIPPSVPTNGLVGYYPFTKNANDLSGNLNNGTVYGSTLTTDRFNNTNSAYLFNGISNYIKVADSPSLRLADFTISAWIYQDIRTPVATKQIILHKDQFPYNYGIFMSPDNNPSGVFNLYGVLKAVVDVNSSSRGNWHHVVLTHAGFYTTLYVDNAVTDTLYGTGSAPTNFVDNLYIGSLQGIQNFFYGKIDDIGIWNRALTEAEIAGLYNAEAGSLNTNTLIYKDSITVYPNPANYQITINRGNLAIGSDWNIKIYNVLGQEVYSHIMNTQQHIVQSDALGSAGAYIIKIYDTSNNVMIDTKTIISK